MTKIINGVASEYDIPMKYENKTMTIEVKNDEMLGRTIDSTLHIELIKLQQENKQLKEVIEEVREYINHEWFKRGQLGIIDKSFQEWQLKELLQILDKLKGEMKLWD